MKGTFYGWYIDDEKWVFSGYTVTSDITLTAFFWKEPVYVTDIDGSNTEGYVKCSPQEAKEKGYTVSSASYTYKEKKSKGEIIDYGYLVKVTKVFDDFWA